MKHITATPNRRWWLPLRIGPAWWFDQTPAAHTATCPPLQMRALAHLGPAARAATVHPGYKVHSPPGCPRLDTTTCAPAMLAGAVPTPTQFSQMLRRLPNSLLQVLLDQTVQLLATHLPPEPPFGDTVAFDTKHIIAWVKENNPKTYIKADRFDKTRQPKGDPDCKVGCKRRHNRQPAETLTPPSTPKADGRPVPRRGVGIGEFYWGYASGIVATKAPQWGEFVLAELTQTFDQSDVSYFAPLMAQVERRLGRKPHFGTGDAAFDAFYIYDYFHDAGGMAAIPTGDRTRGIQRIFTDDGSPLCQAGLPMALLTVFQNHTSRVTHERKRWGCPLLHPKPTGSVCPCLHTRWTKGGCQTTMAGSPGARLRYQIDRTSALYASIYRQRTACERIFSQAVDLGIERPKLRNARSIANFNTLIYILLNLRALQRIRACGAAPKSE